MSRGDDGPVGPLAPTQAELQLKALLHRQLDVSKQGVEEAFYNRRVDFAGTTSTLVDSLSAASGVRTQREFVGIESTQQRLQELRDLGLRTEQICQRLEQEGFQLTEDLARKRKKRKLAHPDHLKTEAEDIDLRLRDRAASVALEDGSPRDLPQLSRHEREIERSLAHGTRANPLGKWLITERDHNGGEQLTTRGPIASESTSVLPATVSAVIESAAGESERTEEPKQEKSVKKKRRKGSTCPPETFNTAGLGLGGEASTGQTEPIVPYARSFIEANRMTVEEIRRMPRFSSHDAGCPSRTLYIKNLSVDTTREDLVRIFLGFQKPAEELQQKEDFLEFRLMQAFVTFPSVEGAADALAVVNGFVFNGKPLVIQFGKRGE